MRITVENLKHFGFEVLLNPHFSPDIIPSDYNLFRLLQNFLIEKKIHNKEALKSSISTYFKSKLEELYKRGINDPPKCWAEVVEKDRLYIID